MPQRLDARAPEFEARFAALLAMKREVSDDVDAAARSIVADVRARGDAALIDYTRRFDRVDISGAMRVSAAEIAAARAAADGTVLAALSLAHERIRAFHERQRPSDVRFTDALGVDLGWRWTAVSSVGLYVPGGTASYPSSVLMNAVPAAVAGVERIVMVVPTPDGALDPLVLAAADLAGVHEIYRVGGAQAVAALAYGTQTIPPVVKIVGPGNAYVAAAKRLVFGQVGIDMIAGPSEVLVLADDTANPDWIAADLLAQAEHDASAQSVLITDSDALAEDVAQAVERAAFHPAPQRDRRGELARFRGDRPRRDARRRDSARRPARGGTSRNHGRGRRGARGEGAQRGRDLHRRPHARGDRRLCRRLEPCAADRPLRPFLLGSRSAGLHEAHVGSALRRRQPAPARTRRDRAGQGRTSRRPRALRGDSPERGRHVTDAPTNRLIRIAFDDNSIERGTPDQEHERQIAIYDLIEDNTFALPDHSGGPYALTIGMFDSKLALDIRDEGDATVATHILSLTPFRRILKDYFMVCESYFAAIRTATPAQIEAIDMGRRGLHDEGAVLLGDRLKDKIVCDQPTYRRLFTLITALHWKG